MTDSNDLLSKADALLARWRSGAVVPRPPADYPVLTEVVRTSATDGETRMPEIPAEPDMPVLEVADEHPHLPPLKESTGPAEAGVRALEERVQLRVLETIEPLIAAALEEPLRLRTEELARRLATTIARDARNDILTLVRDAVRSAVARELEAQRDE